MILVSAQGLLVLTFGLWDFGLGLDNKTFHLKCLTYFLVEGESGPLPLGQGEGHGAWADIVISLDSEDKMLARPSPHVNVGTTLILGELESQM